MKSNKVKVISDLIEKNQRIFKIPVYQRNYDWSHKECQKLFEDIIKSSKYKKTHFLGTFVYILGTTQNSTLSELLIIDGQQRLATLYILLKALLDYAKKNENYMINELEEYIYNRRCPDNFKIKLKLIQTDDEELKKFMNDNVNEISKDSNIYKNYNFF